MGFKVRVAHAVVGAAQINQVVPRSDVGPVAQALCDELPVEGPREAEPVGLDDAFRCQSGR